MKHKEESTLRRTQIAARLRDLSYQIEQGTLQIGGEQAPVPESADLKLEYEVKDGRGDLDVEIEWH